MKTVRMFVCLVALAACRSLAVDQDAQLQYDAPISYLQSPLPPDAPLWQRFEAGFGHNADELFADRFHEFKVLELGLKSAKESFDIYRERTATTARYTLLKSAVNGAREATVDLPAMSWIDERQGFFGDFLRNSVGSVAEESVAPLNVSYAAAERSWWNTLSESGDMSYGVRPFRTDPYAFFSLAFREGDTLLLLSNVRYYYRSFARHSLEFALSVPLSYGLSVDLGTAYQIGQRDPDQKLVLKLFKSFSGGGIVHLGFEVRDRPALFAGLALPW